jgi:hypothetical protein
MFIILSKILEVVMTYLRYISNGRMHLGELMAYGPTEKSVIRTKIIRLCDAHDFDVAEWLNTSNIGELKVLLMTLEEIIEESSWD